MNWEDEGIVLSAKEYAEKYLMLTLFTKDHGLHKGLVRQTKTFKSIQPGTFVYCTWKARLADHLGAFSVESNDIPFVRLFSFPQKILCLKSMLTLLEALLPERQSYEKLYEIVSEFLLHIHNPDFNTIYRYVDFEFSLLEFLGFGLDFESGCTLCHEVKDIHYISPKSGKGACYDCGYPYAHKLYPFDYAAFKNKAFKSLSLQKYQEALTLTGFFLSNHVIKQVRTSNELPYIRGYFIQSLLAIAA